MIFVEMNGRLGNQLFRYATARYLQEKMYCGEKMVLSFNKIDQKNKSDKSFYRALLDFKVSSFDIYSNDKDSIISKASFYQKIKILPYYLKIRKFGDNDISETIKIENRYEDMLNHTGVYWFRYGYHELKKSNQKNKFLIGNFESSQYFNDIRDILVDELKPRFQLFEGDCQLYDKILRSNSVCVSIRRGDFLETKNTNHNVCDKEYYLRAIELISERVKNPVFFFFSDDIEWCKNNIRAPYESYYESGKDTVYDKLRLMYSCKHFIISNSTFSWWAQYLSECNNKIVISPKRRLRNVSDYPLIEKNFIKL